MAPEVRVSGANNEPIGVLSLAEALRMAGELDVDLVEISPTAVPPVCRLMDYGKFKYQDLAEGSGTIPAIPKQKNRQQRSDSEPEESTILKKRTQVAKRHKSQDDHSSGGNSSGISSTV